MTSLPGFPITRPQSATPSFESYPPAPTDTSTLFRTIQVSNNSFSSARFTSGTPSHLTSDRISLTDPLPVSQNLGMIQAEFGPFELDSGNGSNPHWLNQSLNTIPAFSLEGVSSSSSSLPETAPQNLMDINSLGILFNTYMEFLSTSSYNACFSLEESLKTILNSTHINDRLWLMHSQFSSFLVRIKEMEKIRKPEWELARRKGCKLMYKYTVSLHQMYGINMDSVGIERTKNAIKQQAGLKNTYIEWDQLNVPPISDSPPMALVREVSPMQPISMHNPFVLEDPQSIPLIIIPDNDELAPPFPNTTSISSSSSSSASECTFEELLGLTRTSDENALSRSPENNQTASTQAPVFPNTTSISSSSSSSASESNFQDLLTLASLAQSSLPAIPQKASAGRKRSRTSSSVPASSGTESKQKDSAGRKSSRTSSSAPASSGTESKQKASTSKEIPKLRELTPSHFETLRTEQIFDILFQGLNEFSLTINETNKPRCERIAVLIRPLFDIVLKLIVEENCRGDCRRKGKVISTFNKYMLANSLALTYNTLITMNLKENRKKSLTDLEKENLVKDAKSIIIPILKTGLDTDELPEKYAEPMKSTIEGYIDTIHARLSWKNLCGLQATATDSYRAFDGRLYNYN